MLIRGRESCFLVPTVGRRKVSDVVLWLFEETANCVYRLMVHCVV
jgi:hypothetical protein